MCIFCGGCCAGAGGGIIRALAPLFIAIAITVPARALAKINGFFDLK